MPLDYFQDPTFRLVTQRGMAARGTKLYAFGQEVPGLLSVDAQMTIAGPDNAVETILLVRMMGTQVLVEVADAPPSAENHR